MRKPLACTLLAALSIWLLCFMANELGHVYGDNKTELRNPNAKPAIVARFSPRGGITDADVVAIDAAKTEILIQAYSFTSKPICAALIAAKQRGVDVQLLIDAGAATARSCKAYDLAQTKCLVRIAACGGLAHNKIMLIDSQTVLTGSFNWSAQAENLNQENQLIITGYPELMKSYRDNWQKCWDAGTPYVPTKIKTKKPKKIE